MKLLTSLALALSLVLSAGSASAKEAPGGASNESAQAAYDDMKRTLGIVPTFMRQFPEEAVAAAWSEMKMLAMNPNTAIPPKYKELLGLAVAAQIPCDYCVTFHTESSKMMGASSREMKEALALAALVRKWSTVVNGLGITEDQFRTESDRIAKHMAMGMPAGPGLPVTDAASAYMDIERTFGFVPSFLRQYPPEGIAGAWRTLKTLKLSTTTAIPPKQKALLSVAVSAQVPCALCVEWNTKLARTAGASDAEIREAVAMAACTRHWSTIVNGAALDPAQFRKETMQMMKHMKQAMAGGKTH